MVRNNAAVRLPSKALAHNVMLAVLCLSLADVPVMPCEGGFHVARGKRVGDSPKLHGRERPGQGGAHQAYGAAPAVRRAQEPDDRAGLAPLRPLRVPVPEGHRESSELVRQAPAVCNIYLVCR